MKHVPAAFFVLLAIVARARAAEEDDGTVPTSALDEAILVTATRFERAAEETGSTVTVVTGEDVRIRQEDRVADAIRVVPGTYVSTGGPPGAATSVFIRGAASNQTLVRIDGVKSNDPTLGGQFNFFDLNTDRFERIEVLRGAASAIYGSDAMAGVVNLVPRQPEGPPRFTLGAEAGSYGYYRFGGLAEGRLEPFSFSLSASRTHWSNDLPNNEYLGDTVSGRIGFDIAEGLALGLSGRWIDAEAEDPWEFPFGDRIEEDDNISRKRETMVGSVDLAYAATDRLSVTFTGSVLEVDSLFLNGPDTAGAPDELESRTEARVLTATLLGDLEDVRIGDSVVLSTVGGLEYESEASKSRGSSAFGPFDPIDGTIRTNSLFAVAEAVIVTRLVLSGGLRYDDESFAGTVWSPSATLLYRHRETDTRIRSNYGQGFRSPTPIEFADPFVGNPDLDVEHSRTFDVGVEQGFADGSVNLGVVWFRTESRDLIAYDPATFRLENVDRARTTGWELTGSWRPVEGLSISAYGTVQDPRNLGAEPGEEDRLPGRPTGFGGGEIRYGAERNQFGVEVYASGSYPSSGKIAPDGGVRDEPGRKLLVRAFCSYEIHPGVVLFARVENLLDDEWYDVETAPNGLGRGFYGGVSFSF